LTIHYFSIPDPDSVLSILYRPLHPLFQPVAQTALASVALFGTVAFAWEVFAGKVSFSVSPGVLVVATTAAVLTHTYLHEFAHALTCKHFGREVHRAGLGWYLVLPVAWVDTTDMWLSGRWPRIAVSWAGPYTNFLIGGTGALAALLGTGPLIKTFGFEFAIYGYTVGLLNLNPLIELDGY